MTLKLVVVRPYSDRIRVRVFKALSRLGIDFAELIPKGTTDADAVQRVLALGQSRLLVPFHAHHDADGTTVHGVSFARALHVEMPNARILMPVSAFGRAGLMLELENDPSLTDRILVLDPHTLNQSSVQTEIYRHLAAV